MRIVKDKLIYQTFVPGTADSWEIRKGQLLYWVYFNDRLTDGYRDVDEAFEHLWRNGVPRNEPDGRGMEAYG